MARARLTDRKLQTTKPPPSGRLEIFDTVRTGLCFRITDKGARSFSHVYRLGGQLRRDTLGSYPATGLAAARRSVADAQELIETGKDPRAELASAEAVELERTANTVKLVAEQFMALYGNQRERWKDLPAIVNGEIVREWSNRPISDITRREGLDLLAAIARRAPVRANRALSVMKLLFGWAADNDYLPASPFATIKKPTLEEKRDRTLTHPEIRAFWQACEGEDWPFGKIGQLLLLTAQRRLDIGGMRWKELDLDAATLEIPSERYKGKRVHIVPLSGPALAIIQELPKIEGSEYVFPSSRDKKRPATDYGRAKRRFDRSMLAAMGKLDPWRLHDLRRTGRTEMSRIGINSDAAESVLGHVFGNIRGRYDKWGYLPEKRGALDRLAAHIMGIVNPPDQTKVVKIRRR